MAESSLSVETIVRYHYCARFVRRCADEFQWKDLSEDVVMDIGCGDELNCCKAILMQFPDVRALIAVDKESTVFQQAHFRDGRIQFCVGDIQDRNPFKSYEGKMNKILSTHTFHHIIDKELGFRNVYRLLKPGAEAGFLFCVNSCLHKFLTALMEMPKYGAILKGTPVENEYPPEHGKQYYKEMLEKIGFKHVRAVEEERRIPFHTDECLKDSILERIKVILQISPEATETFKAEALELYEKTFGRYEGKLCYVTVQLNLLGVKPMESSDSKSNETVVA
ncbi:jhamt [Trichonephila clavata]|uniref:Jhamt n=1 Tax=Trichonephila clavata TaxID=2740835 RepID=A0A8X6M6Q5_TRICU|nr:jhamt [Trichonephila clavata]